MPQGRSRQLLQVPCAGSPRRWLRWLSPGASSGSPTPGAAPLLSRCTSRTGTRNRACTRPLCPRSTPLLNTGGDPARAGMTARVPTSGNGNRDQDPSGQHGPRLLLQCPLTWTQDHGEMLADSAHPPHPAGPPKSRRRVSPVNPKPTDNSRPTSFH